MITRTGQASWQGSFKAGKGALGVGSGNCQGEFNVASRFQTGQGTNPEEMIGAAHAGCFSMSLSNLLGEAGLEPTYIYTKAAVNLDKVGDGYRITSINLQTEGEVAGLDDDEFRAFAGKAKENCPVSRALSSVDISLETKLSHPQE